MSGDYAMATGRITIDVQIWYRRKVKRQLAATAWNLQLDLDVAETRRWLGTELRVTVTGPFDKVEQFLGWTDRVNDILRLGRL